MNNKDNTINALRTLRDEMSEWILKQSIMPGSKTHHWRDALTAILDAAEPCVPLRVVENVLRYAPAVISYNFTNEPLSYVQKLAILKALAPYRKAPEPDCAPKPEPLTTERRARWYIQQLKDEKLVGDDIKAVATAKVLKTMLEVLFLGIGDDEIRADLTAQDATPKPARTDTERLEWLLNDIKEDNCCLWYGGTPPLWLYSPDGAGSLYEEQDNYTDFVDPRAAIDAAIGGEGDE